MSLFKYMERKYAEELINDGKILLRTLSDFRKSENYTAEIGDSGEGTKTIHFKNQRTYIGMNDIPLSLTPYFMCDNTSTFQFGIDTKINIQNDYLVFCLSKAKSLTVMQKMDRKYDTCVEIFQPKHFFSAIVKALQVKAPSLKYIISDCIYENRVFNEYTDQGYPEALLKPKDYSYQQEVRIIFYATDLPKEKIIIQNKEAAKYCKIIILSPYSS